MHGAQRYAAQCDRLRDAGRHAGRTAEGDPRRTGPQAGGGAPPSAIAAQASCIREEEFGNVQRRSPVAADSPTGADRRCPTATDREGNWNRPRDGAKDDPVFCAARISKGKTTSTTETGAMVGGDRPDCRGRWEPTDKAA